MKDFSFSIPGNIQFGMGSLKKLPALLAESGCKSAFLVSDHGLEQTGLVKRVENILQQAGCSCCTFLEILPNPTVDMVNTALQAYQKSNSDCIVALGGGSPMDVAKAVGILASYGGDIRDYVGVQKVPGPIAPFFAVPTTAGTGSEVTASSVITDSETNFKMSIVSYQIIPRAALLDPELIMTLPASVAAACGIDAFIHALEAYLSKDASPFTDAMAEKAMELIGKNLRLFVASRDNEEAACAMMLGSTMAGAAFARANLGNVHAMSHPVSGFFHVPHGVANAILLPYIVEYNALADNGRYRVIYDFITNGKKSDDAFRPEMLADELRDLNRSLGIPSSLSDVGVTEDKLPAMVADALKSRNVAVNPRMTTAKDVEFIYRQAL